MPETADILKKIRRLELRTRRLVASVFAGQYHSVFKGRGMNFEDVRAYNAGDEVRFIDRNVTARTGDLHVKNFTEERELTVVLLVDVSASGGFGSVEQSKRELAAEVASLLAFSAIGNRDQVGLLLFAEEVELFLPPRKGRGHVLRLIREVLYHQPRGRRTDIAAALEYLNRVVARRAVVFLLSDFQAPDFSRPLAITSRRHDLVAVPVVDPLEESLPDVGRVSLEDAETGRGVRGEHLGSPGARGIRPSGGRPAANAHRAAASRRGGHDHVAHGCRLPPGVARFFPAARAPDRPPMNAASPPPDIRSIVPPQPFYLSAGGWWLVAAGAGIALAVAALWFLLRRPKRPLAGPTFTPRQIAARRLQELEAQMDTLDARAFGSAVADVLRVYIGAQYGLHPERQTSEEFLSSITDSRTFSVVEHALLREFLESCDLLKFARAGRHARRQAPPADPGAGVPRRQRGVTTLAFHQAKRPDPRCPIVRIPPSSFILSPCPGST